PAIHLRFLVQRRAHCIGERYHVYGGIAFVEESGGEVCVGEAGKREIAAAADRPLGSVLYALFVQFVIGRIEVERVLVAAGIRDREIAESAAPLDHVLQWLPIQ